MTIRIENWNETFESADSRKRQRLGWFLSPTGCESKGYRKRMRSGTDGVIALGVFQALCQVMGTLGKSIRKTGMLVNSDGSPMDFEDLAEMTRLDVDVLTEAIEMLVSVGWLSTDKERVVNPHAGGMPVACRSHADGVPENSGFVQGEGQGEGEVKTKQKESDWNPCNTMLRLGALFKRRPSTRWSDKELKAFRKLEIEQDDLALVERFHADPRASPDRTPSIAQQLAGGG